MDLKFSKQKGPTISPLLEGGSMRKPVFFIEPPYFIYFIT